LSRTTHREINKNPFKEIQTHHLIQKLMKQKTDVINDLEKGREIDG